VGYIKAKWQNRGILMEIKKLKALNSISRILAVLIVLFIVPSCALASENKPVFSHGGNITAANFTDAKSNILDSISNQITELKELYANVSEANNATELQTVLANHMPITGCMGPSGIDKGPGQMNGFNLDAVANATDDNFTDVQTKIVDSLGNMTSMLNDQLNDTNVSNDCNRTTEINARIAEIQNLSTKMSEASNATELKEVVLTSMKTQTVESIDKEIEHLQTQINDSKNTSGNTTELNSSITELTTLKEKINAAESLDSLKEILSSSHGIHGIGGLMGPEEHRENGPGMDHPPKK
jgi:hypothetical protein